jgi:four helix bundle protein
MRFDPEKMAVYRLAREHTRAVRDFLAAAETRGFSDLVRQLRESTASVPANILEGNGAWTPAERAHYFRIARGSVMESWAHADTMVDFGLIDEDPPECNAVRDKQHQIVALLTTTILALEKELMEEEPATP